LNYVYWIDLIEYLYYIHSYIWTDTNTSRKIGFNVYFL